MRARACVCVLTVEETVRVAVERGDGRLARVPLSTVVSVALLPDDQLPREAERQ